MEQSIPSNGASINRTRVARISSSGSCVAIISRTWFCPASMTSLSPRSQTVEDALIYAPSFTEPVLVKEQPAESGLTDEPQVKLFKVERTHGRSSWSQGPKSKPINHSSEDDDTMTRKTVTIVYLIPLCLRKTSFCLKM